MPLRITVIITVAHHRIGRFLIHIKKKCLGHNHRVHIQFGVALLEGQAGVLY